MIYSRCVPYYDLDFLGIFASWTPYNDLDSFRGYLIIGSTFFSLLKLFIWVENGSLFLKWFVAESYAVSGFVQSHTGHTKSYLVILFDRSYKKSYKVVLFGYFF